MELPAKYDPNGIEDKWYAYWLKNGHFRSVPDQRKPYTVVIPPPNVTGVLHMGHMLNNTIQDVLVRRARMLGKNACWVPGTDHASIATEAKVVGKLKQEGRSKQEVGRDGFLEEAWTWTHKHGGIILEQLKKLGASCDWDRTTFTMDDDYSEAVLRVFIDLYERGLIYRGHRMVNWDPEALTTVSDEEVTHKEVQAKLYYLRYMIEGSREYVVVATTRPETILGDTAVCVHPEDERYAALKGRKLIVPVANRAVPVIFDEYVDREFGTGALKITPAHDVNDHELGKKHGLETLDIFNANGTLNELGGPYKGMDRFAVRKQISKDLEAAGLLEKVEDYTTSVGTSERTGAVIEPRLSLQWYVKMGELTKPALEAVLNQEVKLIPDKFVNTYRYWMEQGRDWCISRQLWWGHQIPAWHYGQGANDFVVAPTAEEALEKARVKLGNPGLTAADLHQDPDTLDTWFSSWLWPMQVFNGVLDPENEEYKYYYPTADLVTAPEILFFWVARMIMAGYAFDGRKPFDHVYLHGIVRDKQGRKMSKSLGNSPDPIGLINTYGADGVRVGMLLSAPAGNDILFDEDLCLQGRNFANKVWNAFRLVKGWEVTDGPSNPAAADAVRWMENRFNQAVAEIDDSFAKFRISEALMGTYRLVWDDFCSWYLEAVKPEYGKPVERETLEATERFFDLVLRLLHPFMPFISEEIWHFLRERGEGSTLNHEPWPSAAPFDAATLADFDHARDLVSAIRNLRNEKGLSPKEALEAKSRDARPVPCEAVVRKLANVSSLVTGSAPEPGDFSLRVGSREYLIPLGEVVDAEAEKAKLETELNYQLGFLNSVEKKLSNERFVSGAPEAVVASERKKKADAEARIAVIREQLSRF